MAYQNVGTPRFYVNILEWLSLNGVDVSTNGLPATDSIYKTIPSEPVAFGDDTIQFSFGTAPYLLSSKSFVALLALKGTGSSYNFGTGIEGIVNYTNPTTEVEYNGFSMASSNLDNMTSFTFNFGWDTSLGSLIFGTYYDLPHSPDLNLTMSREMDGVKKIRTKGGTDLVNHRYIKPAMWGAAGAWELYEETPSTPGLSRSGRRTWDLSFNHLDGSDVFGSNQSIGNWHSSWEPIITTDGGYDVGDVYNTNVGFNYNILTDDNFFSQVIHKTNGGQLPFIFNPDGGGDTPNNNPDMFAICKLDMSSFKFNQVANGVYNVKLKIREVW